MAAPKKKPASGSPVKASAKAPAQSRPKSQAEAKAAAGNTAKALPGPDTPSKSTRARKPKAELISSTVAYRGRVFSVNTDTVREPNGTTNQRDVIHHTGSVVVLAVDESAGKRDPAVILIRQYRHAVGQYLLELPAGRMEPNERPLAAAKREMIEETGFRAKKWTLLTRYFASPGFLGEAMNIFLAQDLTPGMAQPEADEDIELIRMPLSEAMRLVAANKIQDGKTLIGLSLFSAAQRSSKRG